MEDFPSKQPAARRRGAGAVLLLALLGAVAMSGCITGTRLVEQPDLRIASGQHADVPFHVDAVGKVHITVESRNATPFAVCIVPAGAMPAGGTSLARVCHDNVRQANAAVELPAGDWAIAIRCSAPVDSCLVAAQAFET